jgi:KDO2-lipid IV(A) lauroyltransferase
VTIAGVARGTARERFDPMASPRVRPLQYLEYALIRTVFAVLALVPEVLAYRFARSLGSVFLRFSPKRRGYALRQLRNAFPGKPDAELLRHASRGLGNLLQVSLDMARMTRLVRSGEIVRRVDMSEVEALDIRPPFLGITPHLGGWEVAAIMSARTWGELHVTARLMKNPLAQRWLARTRAEAGVIVHDRRGGVRGIARALERGCVVMQVVDQHQRLRGVIAPWFGELASCERAAATLALRTQLPVGVGTAIRQGDRCRFRFVVQTILEPEPPTGDRERDLVRMVTRMNEAQEALIRRFPDQYLWIHNRYRTPEGDGGAGVADDGVEGEAGQDAEIARGQAKADARDQAG